MGLFLGDYTAAHLCRESSELVHGGAPGGASNFLGDCTAAHLRKESTELVHGGASNYTEESERYGISSESGVVTPEPAHNNNSQGDVAGVQNPTMPPEHFHQDYMVEEHHRRSKDNDFQMKVNTFLSLPS